MMIKLMISIMTKFMISMITKFMILTQIYTKYDDQYLSKMVWFILVLIYDKPVWFGSKFSLNGLVSVARNNVMFHGLCPLVETVIRFQTTVIYLPVCLHPELRCKQTKLYILHQVRGVSIYLGGMG